MRSLLTSWISPAVGIPVVPSRAIEWLNFVPAAILIAGIPCYGYWVVKRGLLSVGGTISILGPMFAIPAILVAVGLWFRAVRRKRQAELESFRRVVDGGFPDVTR